MKKGKFNVNWRGGKINKLCIWCGMNFKVWKYRKNIAKFCGNKCRIEFNIKKLKSQNQEKHPQWKGGKGIMKNGYFRINLGHNGRDYEHRKIMEDHLGRKLTSNEVIHHLNYNKTDNRIENLEILTRNEHVKKHNRWSTNNNYLGKL